MFRSFCLLFSMLSVSAIAVAQSPCENGQCQIGFAPPSTPNPALTYDRSICVSAENKVCSSLSRCCGCFTELGFLTADHCDPTTKHTRFPRLDMAIDFPSRSTTDSVYRLSTGRPSYFWNRRGQKVAIAAEDSNDREYLTDVLFFPGESGSPIFDSDGAVCGIAAGNVYDSVSSHGIVPRVSALLVSASAPASLLSAESLTRRQLRTAARSILAREGDVSKDQRPFFVPLPMEDRALPKVYRRDSLLPPVPRLLRLRPSSFSSKSTW